MKNYYVIKKIAIIGILTALSVVLIYFIHFQIIPMAPFLEYDAGDIPIFLCTYIYGPVSGLIIGVIASIIQGLTVSAQSGWIGVLMHIFAVAGYSLITGFLLKKDKSMKRLVVSVTCGILAMTIIMIICNLIFTPIFMGQPIEAVIALMPYIILFNLIKATANSILSVIIFKILENRKLIKNI